MFPQGYHARWNPLGGGALSRKFSDLTPADLAKLPGLSQDHFCIGEERIHMHLSNGKKMHWYLGEYGPVSKRFFGFFVNKTDGIASGFCGIDDILSFEKKEDSWIPRVDEDWKPMAAKEIPVLQGYIQMMVLPPDIM
jgi:hypothetical protein